MQIQINDYYLHVTQLSRPSECPFGCRCRTFPLVIKLWISRRKKKLSGSEGDLFPTQFFDFFDLDLRYFERYRVGVFVESGEERLSLFADLRQACFLFVGCNISRQGNKTQQEKC